MGFFSSVISVLTGGVSDLVQGHSMGSGTLDLINDVLPEHTFLGQVVPSLLLPAESANRDIGDRWRQGGSAIDVFSDTFERLADPTHSVNYSLEGIGQRLPEGIRKAAPGIGATIGTIAYPVAGTALGYGIGAHLAGQNSTQALTGAGTAATAAWAGGALSDQIGGAAGKVAGNVASTAIKTGGGMLQNALASNPAQMKQALLDLKPYEQKQLLYGTYGKNGLMQSSEVPTYQASKSDTNTPKFEKTELPKLSDYSDSKEKKIAEALTDEYKNYKLNDYMLYKQDPEKLKEIMLKYA
jgi:hypothetical protein